MDSRQEASRSGLEIMSFQSEGIRSNFSPGTNNKSKKIWALRVQNPLNGNIQHQTLKLHLTTFLLLVSMEAFFQERSSLPRTGWAIWHQGRPVKVSDETILQIRAAPMNMLGWCDEELGRAWKKIFPITHTNIKAGFLPLDHPAWGQTPNP